STALLVMSVVGVVSTSAGVPTRICACCGAAMLAIASSVEIWRSISVASRQLHVGASNATAQRPSANGRLKSLAPTTAILLEVLEDADRIAPEPVHGARVDGDAPRDRGGEVDERRQRAAGALRDRDVRDRVSRGRALVPREAHHGDAATRERRPRGELAVERD